MSEGDWDTVTKIGSKVRGPGANTNKEKVIRSESQLNAARRQGAEIATEKKYGGANQVGHTLRLHFRLPRGLFRWRRRSAEPGKLNLKSMQTLRKKWGEWDDDDLNEWTNMIAARSKAQMDSTSPRWTEATTL